MSDWAAVAIAFIVCAALAAIVYISTRAYEEDKDDE